MTTSETKKLFPTEKGTAQGSPISPTICNMVLDGLERALLEKYHKTKRQGKAYFPKVNFVRYADNFIVTSESKELLEEGVLPIIRDFLRERGLELAEDKTVITHVNDGFDFLGCNVKWYKDKLLIKPSDKNPKKSHKWIAQKYFHQQGTRTWTFSEEIAQGQTLRLIYATDTDITRFLKRHATLTVERN